MRAIVLGNGAAGIAAAETIRKKDSSAEILVISDEPYYHYSRPRVIEFLSGKASKDGIVIRKKEWYEKNKISALLGERVEKIEPGGKQLVLSGGKTEKYDTLVIAAGAYSFIPPFPGSDLPGVFGLRTINDAEKIIKFSEGKKDALVIGGGLLGIESAMALSARGLSVTVAEVFDRLLPRQLDTKGAGVLQGLLEAKGLKFLLPRKTVKIEGQGRLKAVFESAEPAEADLILISAGIRCSLGIIKDTGINSDKGIKVNDSMETNVSGIYAAGDIIEHQGRLYGIWPAAKEQGEAAGNAITGNKDTYKGTVMATKLKVAGIDLASAGRIEEQDGDEILMKESGGIYKKLIIRENRLQGAILLGDVKEYSKIQGYIKSKTDISGEKEGVLF